MREKSTVRVAMDKHGVIGRRGFLRTLGLGAAAGLATPAASFTFNDIMAVHAEELRKKGMSCIVLWMQGGPSQFETFDPKPDHENGAGTKALETKVPGIRLAQGWEQLAKVTPDVTFIRSMTNKEGNHQRATYQMHTGYIPTGNVKHPSFGSNVACELSDPKFDLPHQVTIGGRAQDGGIGAGFLGVAYEPFLITDPTRPPENTTPTTDASRFSRRLDLLGDLERQGYAKNGGLDRVKDHAAIYGKTASMVRSPRMKAFQLDEEPEPLRDAYGRNPFGQGCLLARRLVEAGVTFIEVRLGNWDTHDDVHERTGELISQADPGFATLVTDLKQRGLLEKTMVVWMGEFGRTPKVSGRGGRDHFPRCFNIALAGGGVKGGQVIGSSTPDGADVKERPVQVNDLLKSFCQAFQINPAKENISPQGRPVKIVDGGEVVKELFA